MTTRSDVVAACCAMGALLVFIACAAYQRPSERELKGFCAIQAYRMGYIGESFVTIKADAKAQHITITKKDSMLTCTAFVR